MVLGIQCEIHTRILTTPELSPQRVRRLELLCQLHDQGLSDQNISQWFNMIDLRTPRGKKYTPKNVWVSRKKWISRKQRETDTYFVIDTPNFFKIERTKK